MIKDVFMRVAMALTATAIALTTGCSNPPEPPPDTPEQAVRDHIEAAESNDIDTLRQLACGGLADQLATRDDEQIQTAFQHYYDPKPDEFSALDLAKDPVQVLGFYTGISDLFISFDTEYHGRWQVCAIYLSNGPFGALPDPFGDYRGSKRVR
ncbi:hypothetical protein AB0L82_37135 [Nocardia sp. NPDC052001]|uniref:hypothetical protein n=1 Tax=Nocardia sp. NPDC052001 TaxID=3154853 RepID=UPI003443F80C